MSKLIDSLRPDIGTSTTSASTSAGGSVSFGPEPIISHKQRRGRRRSVADVSDLDQVEVVVPTSTMKHNTSVKMSQFCVEKLAQSRKRLTQLYGREDEIKVLNSELDQVCQGTHRSLVLIHGIKGQGKRALASQLEAPAKKQGAFFIEFGLAPAGEPYSGIKAAIRQLCQKLSAMPKRATDPKVKTMDNLQAIVAKELEWELALLCQVMPELSILSTSLTRDMLMKQKKSSRNLLRNYSVRKSSRSSAAATPKQPLKIVQESTATSANDEVHALKGNVRSAPDRLQFALRKLINVLCTFCPLILVCNDAQFADGESLKLLQGWITDTQNPSLMLVWTYQSDLVEDDHLLATTIQKIREVQTDRSIHLQELALDSIAQDDVNSMISDLLGSDDTTELTSVIYHKTFGNMFYVWQYLVSMAQKSHLVYSLSTLQWSWNLDHVRNSLTATASVVDLMKDKLQDSTLARKILPLAACLGATFDVWVLEQVLEGVQDLQQEDNDNQQALQAFAHLLGDNATTRKSLIGKNQLEILEHQGLIEAAGSSTGTSYSFIHEDVLEGALAMVGDADQLNQLKFLVGCILYDRRRLMDEQEADQILFLVCNLLNAQLDAVPPERQHAVLEINIAAGDEAYLAAAFRPSAEYYGAAVKLLPPDHWDTMYQTSLHLFTSAAEAEMCLGNYEQMAAVAEKVLNKEKIDIIEKMALYEVKMNALMAQKEVAKAWDESLHVLKQAKSHFPRHRTKAKTAMAIAKLKLNSKHFKPEALDKLPVSEDPMDEEISKIHDKQIEMALMVQPHMFPLTIYTAVQHVIDRGLTRYSASVLSWFGVLLCGVLGDFQWGDSNLKFVYSLLDRFENRLVECRVIVVSTLNVAHWTSAIQGLGDLFVKGYARGMETSDLVTGFWGAYFYHEVSFCSGRSLALLGDDAERYSKQMEDYGMLNQLENLKSVQKLIVQLRGLAEETSVSKEAYAPNTKGLQNHLCHSTKDRLRGAAFFGEWELGAELGMKYIELIGKVLLGQYASVVARFLTSLCCFEMASRHTHHKKKYLRYANTSFKIIQKWSANGNPNTQHYHMFLKAEKAACKGRTEKAVELYKETILRAGRAGFNHDQALACERLASLHIRMGDTVSAKYMLEDALRLYEEWGAAKKVELLREQLGEL